jgi:signal transduction histidine kinase
MSTRPQPHEHRLESWERRELPFFALLPYAMLLVAVGLDVAVRGGITAEMRLDLAAAAGALAVMLALGRLDSRDRWDSPTTSAATAPAALGFLTLVGLMAVLVIRQPLYGFYTFTGYIWAFRMLKGRARLFGVALVAVLAAISQTGSGPYDTAQDITGLVIIFLINAGVACAFTWFGFVGNAQRDRRTREISQLTEANARLEDSLRQNAELHERLVAQAREAGVADERRRMAREIHDTLAQGLTGIVTQLQAAQRAGADAGPGSGHIDAAIGLARDSLSEARRSVQALRPEPLDDVRLPDAVQEVAGRWSELNGIPVAVTTTGTARVMHPEIEVALLRTAQEALANVAKHARASRVGLTLSYMEDLVTLDVRDDGVGFATVNGTGPVRPRDAEGGFGLAAMRQRVEGVAGRLEIESEPRGGTAISAAIPIVTAAG